MPSLAAAWTRLDLPGAEVAHLEPTPGGWQLAGTTVCAAGGMPITLRYSISCSASWETTAAVVRGHLGVRAIDLAIRRAGRDWFLGESRVAGLDEAVDLDLALSPATNLLPLRRLELAPGRSERVVSAWLRFPELDLVALEQTYRRLDGLHLHYESAQTGYAATLALHDSGFVREYPGLWRMTGFSASASDTSP